MKIYFSPDYVLASYALDTTRKSGHIAESLMERPISGLELVQPRSLTLEEVQQVHDAHYVQAVATGSPRELAESQGFLWDEGLLPMVLSSNGGAVAAALTALEEGVAGSLSSGLHHARRQHGSGCCTFNGLALAAQAALRAGARHLLVLDVDAHCGGGTQSLTVMEPKVWHLDISVSRVDRFTSTQQQWTYHVEQAEDYLPTIFNQLIRMADAAPHFDLCLYNAGMDPFEGCDVGGLAGITASLLEERERRVFQWCRERSIPIAFMLAGGYQGSQLSKEMLVDLHRLTLRGAAGLL